MNTEDLLLDEVKEIGIVQIIIQYKKELEEFEEIDLMEIKIIEFIDKIILNLMII